VAPTTGLLTRGFAFPSASLSQEAGLPQSANKYLCMWANENAYLAEVVRPVVISSWSAASLQYIGIDSAVLAVPVPLYDVIGQDGLSEEQDLLVLHLRLFISHIGQLLTFALLHQTPPWQWVLYLEGTAGGRTRTLTGMRRFWDLVISLEESTISIEQGFAKLLTLKESDNNVERSPA